MQLRCDRKRIIKWVAISLDAHSKLELFRSSSNQRAPPSVNLMQVVEESFVRRPPQDLQRLEDRALAGRVVADEDSQALERKAQRLDRAHPFDPDFSDSVGHRLNLSRDRGALQGSTARSPPSSASLPRCSLSFARSE